MCARGMEERLMGVLRGLPGHAHALDELLDRAKIPAKKAKEAKRALKGLVSRGLVEKERGRRYRLSRAGQELEGNVELDGRGQPVVYPEGPRRLVSPITLLAEDGDAVDAGDRVRVELVVRGRQGKHFARLVEVLERPRQVHIGVFTQTRGATFVEVELPPPDGPRFSRRNPRTDVIVHPDDTMGAEDGDLVQIEIEPPPKGRPSGHLGRVLKVLGKPGERPTEIARLIIEHGLDREFPPDVIEEAEAFGDAPSEADIEGRRDARDLPLVTIDGATAKDFDDAVCALKKGSGYVLYVAIADVSHYVRPGSALDQEAHHRATSTYLTDRAIPMLPEALSNGLCSLNPHVDRLCMLAELSLDPSGRVRKSRFEPAVMRSKARLTYERVAQALDGDPPDDEVRALLPNLLVLSRVASKLLEHRLKRGAIDLDLPEPEIRFEGGEPVAAVRRPRSDAHRLIEDLMLAANEAVARFFVERDLPAIFRVHEDPDPERLQTFIGLCEHLGLRARLSESPRPGEIAHLVEQLSDHRFGKPLHGLLLRSLAQARYEAECKGHYGLATEHYLHFTSPIRRYPDLVVHRLLKQVIAGGAPKEKVSALEKTAEHCSNREREAMKAERSTLDLDRAVIASKRVGETFDATISGVVGFGLFCSLDDPFVDGLVPVQTLPSDYYELDDFGAMLVGQNTGRRYMVGDAVKVEIVHVDVSKRKVDLRLVRDEEELDEGGKRDHPKPTRHKGRREEPKRASRSDPRRSKGKPKGRDKPAKGRASGRKGASDRGKGAPSRSTGGKRGAPRKRRR